MVVVKVGRGKVTVGMVAAVKVVAEMGVRVAEGMGVAEVGQWRGGWGRRGEGGGGGRRWWPWWWRMEEVVRAVEVKVAEAGAVVGRAVVTTVGVVEAMVAERMGAAEKAVAGRRGRWGRWRWRRRRR